MSRTKICRYNCGIELGQFDEKENKYRETSSGMLHTRERYEAMKNTMWNNTKPAMELWTPNCSSAVLIDVGNVALLELVENAVIRTGRARVKNLRGL